MNTAVVSWNASHVSRYLNTAVNMHSLCREHAENISRMYKTSAGALHAAGIKVIKRSRLSHTHAHTHTHVSCCRHRAGAPAAVRGPTVYRTSRWIAGRGPMRRRAVGPATDRAAGRRDDCRACWYWCQACRGRVSLSLFVDVLQRFRRTAHIMSRRLGRLLSTRGVSARFMRASFSHCTCMTFKRCRQRRTLGWTSNDNRPICALRMHRRYSAFHSHWYTQCVYQTHLSHTACMHGVYILIYCQVSITFTRVVCL